MRSPANNQHGFTLIEIIVTLILLGIMAATGGMFLVQAVKGYMTVQSNVQTTQQAQLAMARISREIMEMLTMTAGTSTSLSLTYIGGSHTVGLDDGKIKINSTGGDLSGGDILIDNVHSFSLTYWSGTSAWSVSNDIQLLSAVDIDLQLDRPEGGVLQFVSRVAPRNNKNLGGAAPTTAPPAAPAYGCFVATTIYGNPYHPYVLVLKAFRDRYLLTWWGGRRLSQAYYDWGPVWANWLGGYPQAAAAVRFLLMPLIGLAFLAVYAPAGLVWSCLLALMVSGALSCRRQSRLTGRGRQPAGEKGSVLIGLLLTMSIIAILGAAMVTLFSSSTFSHVADASGRRAYFLAESGFRYAASQYLNAASDSAKMTVLSGLNNQTCNLLNNGGSFQLHVYPYWFRVSSVSNTNLTVQVYGQIDSSLSLSSGYLWINNTRYPYASTSGATAGATSFTFVASSAWPAFSSGTDVFSAALPSGSQTVTRMGSLTLGGTGAGAFPLINGNFRLDPAPTGTSTSTVYTYQKRNGNTLVGIDLVDTTLTWTNLTVTSATNVILDKYLRLDSTGTFAGYSRQVIYNIPIGWMAGGTGFQKVQAQDSFSTAANWSAPSGGGGGTHSIQTIDSGSALKVDSAPTVSGVGSWAMIFFNSGNTLTNLPQAWMDAQGFLTYDLQVKVHNNLAYFMAGMGFRARNNADNTDLYTYGVSFLRARQSRSRFLGIGSWSAWYAPSDLDPDLIPGYTSDSSPGPLFSGSLETSSSYWDGLFQVQDRYALPVIVLWQRTSAGNTWLAYRTLTAADGIVTYNGTTKAYRLVDWSTLMIRVAEGASLAFNNGGGTSGAGVPIKVGDIIQTADGTKSARVVMTPILTAGSWGARTAQGTFVLSNIQGTFASGDLLYVGSTQLARANGNLDATKRNYIRVLYTRPTAQGTANAVETDNNRLANVRGNVNWPPDDLNDLSAANDYVTLVQWTDHNTGVDVVTATNEANAIVRTAALVTATWTTGSSAADFSGDSISLMTLTNSATSTYYDDFGIQLFLRSGTGFLPPIQQ